MKAHIKRRSPIAKSLVNNSLAAMCSAIEIHNKPNFKYRYEVVVLLVINAWELLLKAYIYKYHKNVKLFRNEKQSKIFPECVAFVASQHQIEFQVTKENLDVLYIYRNNVAHFYTSKLDIVIFALLKKTVILYDVFLHKHFNFNLADQSDFALLPIGFSKPYSPLDFITNQTTIADSSPELKNFLKTILDSTQRLAEQGIDEPIMADFKVNLINEKRTKNADIIAGINNKLESGISITVTDSKQLFRPTDNPAAPLVRLTHDMNAADGILLHEQLSGRLFQEINNVLDANSLLATGQHKFLYGKPVYYRFYAERENISYNVDNLELLAETGFQFYGPILYWLAILPPESCAKIIVRVAGQEHNLQMLLLIRVSVLLGLETCKWLFEKERVKWGNHSQPPNFYYNLKKLIEKGWNKEFRLMALGKSDSTIVSLPNESIAIRNLAENTDKCSTALSNTCMSVFEGDKSLIDSVRTLDILTYGQNIMSKSSAINDQIFHLDPVKPKT